METTVPTTCTRCGVAGPHFCQSPATLCPRCAGRLVRTGPVDWEHAAGPCADPGPLPVDVDLPTVETVETQAIRHALKWLLSQRELEWAIEAVPATALTAIVRETVRSTLAL